MSRRNCLPVVLLALALALPAYATNYYVRVDGDDAACNGLADASSASAPACAKRKISAAEALANTCGDVVNVGAGEFFETAKINLNTAGCTSGTKKVIRGAGPSTVVYFGLIGPLTNCAAAGTYTYTCDVPSGGMVNSATNGQDICFVQKLGSNTIDWNYKSNNGVEASEYVSTCLTPASGTTGTIDSDDTGTCLDSCKAGLPCKSNSNCSCTPPTPNSTCVNWADADLDTNYTRGFWYAGAGATSYTINPAGGLAPSGTIQFYAPITSPPSISWELDAPYQVVENLTMFTAANGLIVFNNTGDYSEVNDVTAYHAYLSVGSGNTLLGARVTNTRILNTTRRIRDKGCGYASGEECSDTGDFVPGSSTPGCKIYGDGTTVDGLECYMGNEGLSFAGQNHSIRNAKSHAWMNHGCKLNEIYTDSTFDNLICYNNQEGLHQSGCQKNLLFRHATIDGTVLYNGPYAANCPDGSNGWQNVEFRNSILGKISHNDAHGVDGRAPDGVYGQRDLDYSNNAYFNESGFITHFRGAMGNDCTFTSMASWQNYTCAVEAADSCTNCERDTNSVLSVNTDLFVNPTSKDLAGNPPDYTLKAGSAAIGLGDVTYTNTTDYAGVTRGNPPDAGAYEYSGGGGGGGGGKRKKGGGKMSGGAAR